MSKPRPNRPASASSNGGAVGEAERNAPSSPKTPVRTDPLPEAQRGAWFEGHDVVTAIREYDGALEFELPRDVAQFTAGASRNCDIALPGRGLSAVHCLLERRGDRLRLLDQHSTNGVYFQDRRVNDVSIAPGATFTLAPVRAADLAPANLAALRAYDWPDNLASLRRVADEIVAHAAHDGLRPAARALGMAKSTLQKHFDRVGLSFPLFIS